MGLDRTPLIALYDADVDLATLDMMGYSEVMCIAIAFARDAIGQAIKMINDEQDNPSDDIAYDDAYLQ